MDSPRGAVDLSTLPPPSITTFPPYPFLPVGTLEKFLRNPPRYDDRGREDGYGCSHGGDDHGQSPYPPQPEPRGAFFPSPLRFPFFPLHLMSHSIHPSKHPRVAFPSFRCTPSWSPSVARSACAPSSARVRSPAPRASACGKMGGRTRVSRRRKIAFAKVLNGESTS